MLVFLIRTGLFIGTLDDTKSKFYKLIFCEAINTLRPRQLGRHFADDTFKHIFLNGNARISIKISLKFVIKGPIN